MNIRKDSRNIFQANNGSAIRMGFDFTVSSRYRHNRITNIGRKASVEF
jgi:hypothetical protein